LAKEMSFDKIVSRDGTNSLKYTARLEKFGTEDILPLWVADMDLPTSTSIQEAMQNRIKHPIYGYTSYSDEYFNSIVRWMKKSHNWTIQKEWIRPINSIVTALALSVETLTDIGDKVIVQPPIYPPFLTSVKNQGRILLENQLILKDGIYEIDFVDFENKAQEAELFLLCSPHNPTGRVWSEDDLNKIVSICRKYGVTIISDEVHSDLVFTKQHTPLLKIDGSKDISIVLNAPSKSFNIAGIVSAYAIVSDSILKKQFYKIFQRYHLTQPTPISLEATIAAYQSSDIWLDTLLTYLKSNLQYIRKRLLSIPYIEPMPVESTFLLWLDCRGLNMSDRDLEEFFIKKVRVGLNSGVSFGSGGSGFMRLNYATSKVVLKEAMNRLEVACKSRL
jgi:cystathionine beta-lyase